MPGLDCSSLGLYNSLMPLVCCRHELPPAFNKKRSERFAIFLPKELQNFNARLFLSCSFLLFAVSSHTILVPGDSFVETVIDCFTQHAVFVIYRTISRIYQGRCIVTLTQNRNLI